MAFENLTDRLQMAFRRMTGRGKLSAADIEEMLKEIRLSLLEADVNYKVVKDFTNSIKEKALGDDILKGLNPGQQVVKVVHDELKSIMGDSSVDITYNNKGTTKLMTVGLQGAGKTTFIGKLANFLGKRDSKKVLMIAADIYRPAAIDQLMQIGKQLNIEVYQEGNKVKPVKIVENGVRYAEKNGFDLVIIDTAGRLHIDDSMMDELIDIKKSIRPDEILLTVDAMTGQDAVNVCKAFNEKLQATGAILTKLDGDTRGGAALSIKIVTGLPIKFIGTGEKLDAIEVFHPDRMAGRILGMGDTLTLIEKVSENISEEEAMSMMEKMMSDSFNYNDMLKQFKMIKRMGSFGKLLGFLPGLGKLREMAKSVDDKQLVFIEAIISSMTAEERKNPRLVDMSSKRRDRIARGSGRSIAEVNKLRQSLDAQKQMAKKMSNFSEEDFENMAESLQNADFDPEQTKNKKGFR
ncbi:MAG: signal recognition particle protein [Erysipelotrichales bacterium]|nr:signal recognition particle protein [Erysipelotrichales bacterium]